MLREPIVAGQFYPDDKDGLMSQIEKAFSKVPKDIQDNALGAVVPHAGYMFSGECAAYSYSAVGKGFDLYIILGFSHAGYGRGSLKISMQDWKTPLGICRTDKEFAHELINRDIAEADEGPHTHEHSIEVQLPFLQYMKEDAKILAITVPYAIDFEKVGKTIAELIKAQKKRICVLASSDFTHFGRNYGYMPFRKSIRENLERLDLGAVEYIKRLDSSGFLEYVEKTGATICGSNPIALQIEVMKVLEIKKADLLRYYTSADIIGDRENSVSYVSLAYRK